MSQKEIVRKEKWRPEMVNWDHPRVIKLIQDNYETKGDAWIADKLSEWTGKNITEVMVRQRRVNRGYRLASPPDPSESKEKEKEVPWHTAKVRSFIKRNYEEKYDWELAKELNERYDTDTNYDAVYRQRWKLGCTGKKKEFIDIDFDVPEKRRFIYLHHPNFGGRFDTKAKMVQKFAEKFNLQCKTMTLQHHIDDFVKKDPLQGGSYSLEDINFNLMSRWFQG